jgi:hypothetical protein
LSQPQSSLRQRLLDAGYALGTQSDASLTAAAVERTARARAGAVRRCFGSMPGYRLALLDGWMKQVRDSVVEATTRLPPGPKRIRAAMEAWLDASLEHPLLRRMLMEPGEPAQAEHVYAQVRGFTLMLQMELSNIAWLRAVAAARLYTAMAIETAFAELEAGRRLPEFRETLFAPLEHS